MRDVEELQREVWGCTEREIVSVMMLIPTTEVGGILVGAFDGQTLVGFAYGFVGYENAQVTIHSDMLAVKPEYRNRRLGYGLKLAQRERALARGIMKMTWTFDPLQSRNAHLNFARLGVVADRYKPDFYGASSSFLHRHTETDRLWVSWLLKSERVRRRIEAGEENAQLIQTMEDARPLVGCEPDGSPRSAELRPGAAEQHLLIEIPSEIGSLQEREPELAIKWRAATRRAFTEALAAGYLVEEFYRPRRYKKECGAYLLTRARKGENSAG